MKTYSITIEVKGYLTKQVQARSKKEAIEKGCIDWKASLADLEDVSGKVTVEKDED